MVTSQMRSLKNISFSIEEAGILREAVKEYEENHYEMESQKWQRIINHLIDRIK